MLQILPGNPTLGRGKSCPSGATLGRRAESWGSGMARVNCS